MLIGLALCMYSSIWGAGLFINHVGTQDGGEYVKWTSLSKLMYIHFHCSTYSEKYNPCKGALI